MRDPHVDLSVQIRVLPTAYTAKGVIFRVYLSFSSNTQETLRPSS